MNWDRKYEIFYRKPTHFVPHDFFVKFDLEIAIDQQTRACDRTSEGVPDFGCPPLLAGQPRPFLVQIMPNHLNMLITKILGALLVASGPLNSYVNFHQDWTKND